MSTVSLGNRKLRLQAILVLVIFFGLYVLPAFVRLLFLDHHYWSVQILVCDAFTVLLIGLLTNNYRFAFLLYALCSAFQIALLSSSHDAPIQLILGDLIPALAAIYFARKLLANMGD